MSSSPTAATAAAAANGTPEQPPATAPAPSTSSVSARVRAFTGQNGGSIGGPTPAFPLPHAAPVPVNAAARNRVASNLPPPLPPHSEHTDDAKPYTAPAPGSLPVPQIPARASKPRLSTGSLSPAPADQPAGHAPTTASPSLPASPAQPAGSPPRTYFYIAIDSYVMGTLTYSYVCCSC
jgi:hypothetical protein